jgi:uncharacterized protein (UPF0248 family)
MVFQILNRLKWSGGLDSAQVDIIHRGAPGNIKTISGKSITEVRKGYVVYTNREETVIPLHRIVEVRVSGEVLWRRRPREG